MKISINTANNYSNIDLKAIAYDALVQKIGAQLGAVEGVDDWSEKFRGIVVARVVTCVNHPNADKLHLCTVDDGGAVKNVERDNDGNVQVVCGAPNVREGLMVAWIPPGATVPASYGTNEPFVLGARELRGIVSNGMLASPAELGLSDNHDGILEIDPSEMGGELTPGADFASLYSLDDYIIDVENKMFTHRPDCFGVIGVARELAGITHQPFKSPSWYLNSPHFNSATGLKLAVSVDIPTLVPRFMAVAMDNVAVSPSPNWLQSALTRIGIRPINNVVDITNYVMYVTGQPLHAYDYDKVAALSNSGAEIVVRHPKRDETISLLNGKNITPRDSAIVIASPKGLLGIGGVMGGADTEVDNLTTRIILEAASFDMYSIRRTAMTHGLFTDAVTRFNKGQSPHQNDRAIAYAIEHLVNIAQARQASEVIDTKTAIPENPKLTVSTSFINERLGLKLSASDMLGLLSNVEFIVEQSGENLIVQAPFWRTDIEIAEDIVEEVGRLYGFDQLPLVLPWRDTQPTATNELLSLKSVIRHSLKAAGANELLNYSFVHGDLLAKVGQDAQDAFVLSNAISPQLQHYRLSLLPSLLEKVHPNNKAGYDEFSLFEIGKTHAISLGNDSDGVPIEQEKLALVYAANNKVSQKGKGATFYKAQSMLAFVLQTLHLEYELRAVESVESPYEATRSAAIYRRGTDTRIGVIGEFTTKALDALKLPDTCAGFELDLNEIMLSTNKQISNYTPLPKFPKVTQDLSLRVPTTVSYGMLLKTLQDALVDSKPKNTYALLEPIDIYTSNESAAEKHITFRLAIASYDRTLTADLVNNLLDAIAASATNTYGAIRL